MNITRNPKYDFIKKQIMLSTEKDPILLITKLMNTDSINMHGPEHHFLDGACFMVSLKNNGLDFDLDSALLELENRASKMPGAMCGFWGMCGSIASLGAVFSIVDKTTPLSSDEKYAKHMEFTGKVINIMSKIGGPRCCKRNAFISISEAIKYANENYGLSIPYHSIKCEFSNKNEQCIKSRCPFFQNIIK